MCVCVEVCVCGGVCVEVCVWRCVCACLGAVEHRSELLKGATHVAIAVNQALQARVDLLVPDTLTSRHNTRHWKQKLRQHLHLLLQTRFPRKGDFWGQNPLCTNRHKGLQQNIFQGKEIEHKFFWGMWCKIFSLMQ